MQGTELYRDFVLQSKIFTFQLISHIRLLKGTPNAVKSFWEPKEGGNAKSKKNCPGQALHHYGSGQAPNLAKVRIFGCFLENNERFGVWPKHSRCYCNLF